MKKFQIFTVAALHLAVAACSVMPDQLMADVQLGGGFLEQRCQIALTVREAVGKLEAVVRLDTLHFCASCGRTMPAACTKGPPSNRWTPPDRPPGNAVPRFFLPARFFS